MHSREQLTIQIDPNDPESVRRALNTEWLLTNGLGGYAMGTVLGANTRRYHGLLVAATQPPVGRIVALHSVIEQLIIPKDDGAEEIIDLSTQQFGDPTMLHPQGHRHLSRLTLEPNRRVEWRWDIGAMQIERAITLMPYRNGISLHYVIRHARPNARLRLRPLLSLRDFHSLSSEVESAGICEIDRDAMVCFRCGDEVLRWFGQTRSWTADPQWWRNFSYEQDRHRGQDWHESQWSAGFFDCAINGSPEARLSFAVALDSASTIRVPPAEILPQTSDDANALRLFAAADQFIVQRRAGDHWNTSVIAGYPWFGDWGRDTMTALPGLMLSTHRIAEAHSCLLMFAKHIKNGLIPNVFDDYGGAAHYNTVDAPLWFVHAVHEYRKATNALGAGERPAMSALIDACRSIIAAYRAGTDFSIRMDDDGLIAAGDEHSQLTWMDAKRDGVVFTPRYGKAVEINALWFNALHCLAAMTDDGMERRDLVALSDTVARSFRAQFWWAERNCLYDISPFASVGVPAPSETASHQLRPNQVFAVSLSHSPLDRAQQHAVVYTVRDRLLTPFGLRTLDRDDPNYRGRYEGSMFERDRAYHNGTVWPWLIGSYGEALLRINEFNAASKRRVKSLMQPLIDEITNTEGGRCLGQIAEVYDGDPPHRPSGCPAQAWSVAEVLRIAMLAGI